MDKFNRNNVYRPVKLLDLAILLYHVHKAAKETEVGFEDAKETIESLERQLNKTVYINPATLESALWSSNLLDEFGKFWHPALTFEEWVKQILGKDKYNRRYGAIETKEKYE